MIVEEEHGREGGPKTSIKMTRSMGEDIGWIAIDIMEGIENQDVNLTYSRWDWFIGFFWNDPIWKSAMSKIITKAKNDRFNLNKCSYFLDFVFERTANELYTECKQGVHPVFRQAFMELVTKRKPQPQPILEWKDIVAQKWGS